MRILLTGICGFVGSTLARALRAARAGDQLLGLDNFIRSGSELNRDPLRGLGVQLFHGDVRAASDVDALPPADWVIDCSANPSVLAGLDGRSSSRQVVEHNLLGTVNLLEYCRRHGAGFILLSTSRVYAIPPLAGLPVEPGAGNTGFRLRNGAPLPPGVSARGLDETFSVTPPVSLYGATKLASETLALEYGEAFGLPVWVNRCGVLAGAGQFGRADQGILAYWINAYLRRKPLRYLGFGGTGAQVRDVFHPRDLAGLVAKQMDAGTGSGGPAGQPPRVVNLGGGEGSAFSLAWLTAWCRERFGFEHPVTADGTPRAFDIPWMVMDGALAARTWAWQPGVSLGSICEEIALHAEANPGWLEVSAPL